MSIDSVQRRHPGGASTGSCFERMSACIARALFSCWRPRAQSAGPLAGFTAAEPRPRPQLSNAALQTGERGAGSTERQAAEVMGEAVSEALSTLRSTEVRPMESAELAFRATFLAMYAKHTENGAGEDWAAALLNALASELASKAPSKVDKDPLAAAFCERFSGLRAALSAPRGPREAANPLARLVMRIDSIELLIEARIAAPKPTAAGPASVRLRVLDSVGYDFARVDAYHDAMHTNPLDESMTYPLDACVWHSPATQEEDIDASDDASFRGGIVPEQGRVAASVKTPEASFAAVDARLNTLSSTPERAREFWTPAVKEEVHAGLENGSQGALRRITHQVLETVREEFKLHWDYRDKEGVKQARARRNKSSSRLQESQGGELAKLQAETKQAEEYLAASRAAAMKSFDVHPLIQAALYDAFTDACAAGGLTDPALLGYLRQLREKLASAPGTREAAQTIVADAVVDCGLGLALHSAKGAARREDQWACEAMESFLIEFGQRLKRSPAQADTASDETTGDLMHLIDMLHSH